MCVLVLPDMWLHAPTPALLQVKINEAIDP